MGHVAVIVRLSGSVGSGTERKASVRASRLDLMSESIPAGDHDRRILNASLICPAW